VKTFRTCALTVSLCWLALGSSARAELPSWLKKQNADVNDGNDAMQKGDPKGALESYNRAAAKLPEAPGVALDRGLSLLKQGDYGKAREALLSATVPNASTDVRADAYQDLSLSFYREADGLASQNNHADAQKLFREALDAAKRSLHLRPGDPNTAWNMELAARRVRDEEQKQKDEEEQKKKDEQNKDQQKQDGDKQNQDQDQKQDGDKGQDQKPDQGKQDQKDKPEPKKPEEQKGQDKPKQPDKPESGEKQPAEPKDEAQAKGLPPEAEQALDSLENGEENFERYRARQRASRERRAPEKDW
jgi:Ca-activated chloride channel family protein